LPAPSGGSGVRLRASDFRIAIDGLDTSRVSTIDPISIEQKTASDQAGNMNESAQEPSKLVVPNLKLALGASSASSWMAWTKSFLIDGNHASSDEKNGSLILTDPSGTPVLTLQLSHLGLVSAYPEPVAMDQSKEALVDVEMYVDTMGVKGASPGASAAGSNGIGPGAGAGGAGSPVLEAPANLASAAPALPTNPADQGAQDPANFPRYPGSVRLGYSNVDQPGSRVEYVVYSTKDSPGAVDAFFNGKLPGAGWTRAMRTRAGDGGSKVAYIETWQKDTRSAMITAGTDDDGSTKIAVALTMAGRSSP
jgi:hypothetical protein